MHAAHRALGLTKGTPERGSPRVRGDQFRVPGDSKMGLAQRGWGSRKDGPTTPPPPHCAHSLSCTRCPGRTHRPLGPVPSPEPQAGCALCLGGYTVQWGEGIQSTTDGQRIWGEASPPPGVPYLIPLLDIEHYFFLENTFLHSFFPPQF